MPARGCGLRHLQGSGTQPHPRARPRSCRRQYPGKLHQPRVDQYAHVRALSRKLRTRCTGRRSISSLGKGPSSGPHWNAGGSGRAGSLPSIGQISILHRRRLFGGRRTAGRNWSFLISVPMTSQPVCVAPTGDVCGEGAVWHAEHAAVYWTDINRFLIHRFTLADQCVRSWFFEEPVTAVVLTDRDDVLAVLVGSGVILWEPDSDVRNPPIFHLEGWPSARLNDGRADPRGTLWVGSMRNNVNPDGSAKEAGGRDGILYRLNADRSVAVQRRDIGISNTVAWSPDRRRFYFGDTLANMIWSYDYDAGTGTISNETPFFRDFERG